MCVNAATAIEAVYRANWGRTVAALIRLGGDFDLAKECAQEALKNSASGVASAEARHLCPFWTGPKLG